MAIDQLYSLEINLFLLVGLHSEILLFYDILQIVDIYLYTQVVQIALPLDLRQKSQKKYY